jgi:hypothetical protein
MSPTDLDEGFLRNFHAGEVDLVCGITGGEDYEEAES